MAGKVESKLNELGITLPHPPAPVAAYVPVLKTGSLVVTSGQLPVIGKEVMFQGKVGDKLSETDGRNAAQLCAVNALAQLKACVGDLDLIRRIVRVEGYVNSAPGFTAQPSVINGASELLGQVFGEAGHHTRIAVGVAELPLNSAVELGIWAEV